MAKRGNGEGSIYWLEQRKRFAAAVTLDNGKRQVLYGRTRREVADKLTTALDGKQRGIPVTSQKMTLDEYLQQWLADTVKPGRRAGTYVRYETAVRKHITPAIGKVKLAKIGPEHVQRLQKECIDKGLGRKSIDLVRATLSGALTQAMRWGLIVRNPVALVEPPYAEPEEPSALTPEQAGALIAEAHDHELEHLIVVMLATGLRIGETLGLRWQDVDLARGRLKVVQQQTVLPGQPVQFTAPKSKSGRRTIPLIPASVDALHAQRARVLAYQIRSQRDREWPAYDLVFPDYLGEPLVGRRVERRFKELLADAELPTTFTPHSLRHSTATYLMAVGTAPKVIMEIMGHSSLAMTAQYQHVVESLLDDAAERLARIFPATASNR